MEGGWIGDKNATAFIVAIGGAIAALGLGTRLLLARFRAAAANRHAVDHTWNPIITTLMARGVTAPELLVCALANYDIDLGPGGPSRPNLPCAVATVARAVGRPVAEVQATLVSRCGKAGQLLEELRGLRPRLEGLPGVVRVGEPWPADPALLEQALRRYSRMSGV